MDQLLNSGAGYNAPMYLPPHNDDDDDNNYPMLQGCLNVILFFVLLIGLGLCVAFFDSCSTHRTTTSVHNGSNDVQTVVNAQQSNVVVADSGLSHIVTDEGRVETHSADMKEENTETVTEHITETIDSAGNTNRTIDRMINRTMNTQSSLLTTAEITAHTDALSAYFSRIDSLANLVQMQREEHSQHNDSTFQEKDPATNTFSEGVNSVRELISKIFVYLIVMAFLVLFVYVGYYVIKAYITNRKSNGTKE